MYLNRFPETKTCNSTGFFLFIFFLSFFLFRYVVESPALWNEVQQNSLMIGMRPKHEYFAAVLQTISDIRQMMHVDKYADCFFTDFFIYLIYYFFLLDVTR